jgi:hypothetical protein
VIAVGDFVRFYLVTVRQVSFNEVDAELADLATLGFSELVFPVFTTTSKVAVGLRPGQQVHILQGCHGEMARQPEPVRNAYISDMNDRLRRIAATSSRWMRKR